MSENKYGEVMDVAVQSKENLNRCPYPAMRSQIVETASGYLRWDVWLYVFHDDSDMITRLLERRNKLNGN